jgi:hypothetical protein
VNACAGRQQAAQMMFSAVSGKLVVALPVLCAEMALGGQYMGAGTCGASANFGSTFVQPRDGMLAQFPPGGEGKLWKFCHWLKSWIP